MSTQSVGRCLVVLGLALGCPWAQGQCPREWASGFSAAGPVAVGQCVLDWADGFAAPGMDEPVHALAVFDDGNGPALYVGGKFYTAGEASAKYIAKWDGSAWSALGDGTSSRVYALAVYDDGSGPALYVGGEFYAAGGVTVRRVARWDGAAWSALGDGVGGHHVSALAVFDDGTGPALYAGGWFETAGGVTVNAIAKWDGQSWSALGSGMGAPWGYDPCVSALAVYDDGSGPALYAGGYLTEAGGGTAYGIARWDGTEWSALGMGVNNEVRSLAVFDDGSGPALYVGGDFTHAGGLPAPSIAKWDGVGWSGLGSGMWTQGGSPRVYALAAYDDGTGARLYAGGRFDTAGGVDAPYLARWDGVKWSRVGSGVSAYVYALAGFDDGSGPGLYVGGDFTIAGEVGVCRIARWDGAVFSALGSGNGMSSWVNALKVFDPPGAKSGPALYVGGRFHAAGVLPTNYIARWDGASWSAVGSGLDADVFVLTVYDDGSGPGLYAGGGFTSAGGVSANRIAKWDGQYWWPLGSGLNMRVFALTVFDDGSGPALYAGGFFTSAGGVEANRVAKWDGASWSALGSGMSGQSGNIYVCALAVFDDGSGPGLYAGGHFDTAGGVSANNIAKWDGENWSPLGSGMAGGQGAYPWVRVLAVFDDGNGPALHVGGNFTMAGGVSVNAIASWDGSTWSPLGTGLGSWGSARTLGVFDDGSGSALYVGGSFGVGGPVGAKGVARWDGTSWSVLGNGLSYGSAHALSGFDDGSGPALYVGGSFTGAGGKSSAHIAKWGCVGDLVLGDANCDGVVDHLDIDPFVMALVNPAVYELAYADCDIRTADCNYDGAVDAFDIDRFVELLGGP